MCINGQQNVFNQTRQTAGTFGAYLILAGRGCRIIVILSILAFLTVSLSHTPTDTLTLHYTRIII